MAPKLQRADYHVAWIAPVSDLELLPSRLMLDEEHKTPDYDISYDNNIYTFRTIAGHNVVIATCLPGLTGNINTGRVIGSMFKTFSNLRIALLVGIGGGIPRAYPSADPTEDVHVGDVVVGWPGDGGPACVYYNSGKWHTDKPFEPRGIIDKPDRKFTFPGLDKDLLFQALYPYKGPNHNQCGQCDRSELIRRPARTANDNAEFIFYHGRVATGNAVIKDGQRRDQIRELCKDALCIEMEAAGVDASGRCLVIRGISDYADSHKDDIWRSYAAGQAAVFARELLRKIPGATVRGMEIQQITMHPASLPKRDGMPSGPDVSIHRLMGSEQKSLPWEGTHPEQAPMNNAETSQRSE
ncbi:kinesin light chain [Apiospora rasikravindrae]|uniref:Kinesin light chain n=1 Tax=Apiospora rasikravindrae TaxID=990691 RepID=A0ABR1SDH1_9PEZI